MFLCAFIVGDYYVRYVQSLLMLLSVATAIHSAEVREEILWAYCGLTEHIDIQACKTPFAVRDCEF
jgi:hypothetical protein